MKEALIAKFPGNKGSDGCVNPPYSSWILPIGVNSTGRWQKLKLIAVG